ncbi:MAG TPA: serine hydrolase domain-containing protein [Candidatus Binatia bacterium]|nr:serine hydrolase domain-containing protein [Candidatus Binatia bacterium]
MRRFGAVLATALVVGFFALGLPSPAPADTIPPLTQSQSDQIDRLALDQVHAGRTPGIAIGVVEDGRLVYARGFGFATLNRHAAMTPDTESYVGNVTMEFTAAAVLLLSQDGKLKLDDPLSKYVPEFKLGADVTIAQLLTQTSGLPSYNGAPGISTDPTHTIKLSDVLAAVDKMKPLAEPGAVYANNPLNYMLAGLVVERASGVTLSDYLEQHIFIPLVMDHTFLAGDNGVSPSHATGYTRGKDGFNTAATWDPAWLRGNSGLVSTIDDLAKWDIEMPVLLRIDAERTIFTPAGSSGPTHYGMGWVIDRRGGKEFVWSDGEISGYRAMNALLPSEHVGVIVLTNADSMHGRVTMPEEVGARVLDILVPPTTAHLDNAVVTRAKEWLERLATGRIDRSELTPSFSAYLTDDLVARENFAALGKLQGIVPLSSTSETNGDTLYEFLVRYPRAQYHYQFEVARDGKVDGITLAA